MNSIHFARKNFDYISYSFQVYMASISYELGRFFNTNISNTIEFWEYSSWCNWIFYKAIDRETRKYQPTLSFPWKISWNFSKKRESKDLINRWKITFQALDNKDHNFLELLDNENNPLELTYFKGRILLKYFGYLNLLCTKATRSVINYVPIGVKIVDGGLNFYFLLFILFYCFLFLFFSFLFLVISHAVTSVTIWWQSHKTDHGTWENRVESSRIKWHHTAWITHASLMSYTWSLG